MLPADTPAQIRRLLRRCLEKDRKDDSIRRPMLDWRSMTRSRFQPPKRSHWRRRRLVASRQAIAALAGLTVIAALVAWILMRLAPSSGAAGAVRNRTGARLPLNVSGLDRDLALSPDGRRLVYRAGGSNTAGSH